MTQDPKAKEIYLLNDHGCEESGSEPSGLAHIYYSSTAEPLDPQAQRHHMRGMYPTTRAETSGFRQSNQLKVDSTFDGTTGQNLKKLSLCPVVPVVLHLIE